MSESSPYWEKIPLWDNDSPEGRFEITADQISGRIPVTRLEHWRDFLALLESPFFNRLDTQVIFRGHRRYDWSMTPTLARVTSNDIITEALASQQLEMLRKAIRGRVSDHSLLEDGPQDDELWSIGQHHGLMTPLLDWTYSPYVALFFAFAKEDQKDETDNPYRAVYILNKSFIADDEVCPDIRVFEPKKDDHGRLVSQAGLFTFSPYDATIENKLTEVLTDEEFQDDELKQATEEEQQECLKHLRRMNVHHASLFPDLIGAADYCNVFTIETERQRLLEKTPEVVTHRTEVTVTPTEEEQPASVESIGTISDLLKHPAESQEVEPGRINFIAEELSKYLSKSMLVDWEERDTLQAEIKNTTRVLLRKYGYPVNARDYVIDNILDVMAGGLMNNIRRKLDLYILSLGLLFVFFIIITIKFPGNSFSIMEIESWKALIVDNPMTSLSIVLLYYCVYAYKRFDFDLKGATEIPFEIKKIEGINYEHLTFLATYVVPLISFDFDSGRQMIVLAFLLIVMGVIYIKTDL
ncbi:anti-phage protein KwaA, partial [Thiolapillus sp.]